MTLSRALVLIALWATFTAPARAQDPVTEELEKAVKEAVRKVGPSVVQIITQGGSDVVVTGAKGQVFRKALGPTTGVIVDADGYVLTSSFNFINQPANILVDVPGRPEPLVAKRVATDKSRMLTLLKVDAKGLPVPEVAPKKEIVEGQWTVAVGRTLELKRGGQPSLSLGIISAKERIWGRALQTDAKTSPVNYGGPLVDLRGRVQGIVIPASPYSEDQTAGHEWYDSGLGFAVPLEDAMAVLPRLKQGKDLARAINITFVPKPPPGPGQPAPPPELVVGVLGVRLRSPDIHSTPPQIAEVFADSLAAKVGLKPDDTIVEVDGKPIARTTQLFHHLGPKYAGDKVTFKIRRDGKDVMVADLALVPASPGLVALPHLGILPMRDDPKLGVEVRYVYEKSPAETAGLKAGDRIVKYAAGTGGLNAFTGEQPGRVQLAGWIATQQPGTQVKLEVARKEGKTETLTMALEPMPGTTTEVEGTVPEKLPPGGSLKKALEPRELLSPDVKPAQVFEKNPQKPETGLLKRATGDGERKYWVYVHEDYDPNESHGLLVWLHPPGRNSDEEVESFIEMWEDFLRERKLILVGPTTQNESGWVPSEADYVAEAVRSVAGKYTVDRQRIVAHGLGVGGQMAIYMGFAHRDLFRGVATSGAVVQQVPDNVPGQRLSFYLSGGAVDPIIENIAEGRTKLVEKRYPTVYRPIPNRGREYLEEPQLRELVRWIDSLDRL